MRRGALLVLLAATLAGCGGSGPSVSSDDLGKVVLRPADLPGLERFDVGPQVRLDNLGTARSDPARYGREGGWKARYRRAGAGAATAAGPLVVESRADVFKSPSGAKKDLLAYGHDFLVATEGAPGSTKRLAPPKLGDDAIAMTTVQPGLKPFRFFRIAWRERNATASVLAQGYAGKLTLAEVLKLARRQESHLRAAEG